MTDALWPVGQAEIEALLKEGKLALTSPDKEGSRKLIAKARTHHRTAKQIFEDDPETAIDALHAGNRKALEAVLLSEGLVPTKDGGHRAAHFAVRAQTEFGGKFRPEFMVYDIVRNIRHDGDYQNVRYDVHPDDIRDNLGPSARLVDICENLIGQLPQYSPLNR